ncbi:MAG: ATP-dependent DNA helicase RecG [Bacteroidales bacterium OttesenSCG-928-I14]|jgi:ATP-dependent DNA helicase RecG|nr:ATP-dependent DNA helicase RecG [Bacteroidales bacterium OttesenSCG-928-I14]
MEINHIKITHLHGIGSQKAEILRREINVISLKDMIYYFPYKYIDRSKIFKISDIKNKTTYIQLKGKILHYKYEGKGNSKRLTAVFNDNTGNIKLIWFKKFSHIPYLYKIGIEYILFGKQNLFKKQITIIHPKLELKNKFHEKKLGIHGQYNTTKKMKKVTLHSHAIKQIIIQILDSTKIQETLNNEIINDYNLINLDEAIRNIHFPKSNDLLEKAKYRLKFEELFYLQLNILSVTKNREKHLSGFFFKKVGNYFNNFYKKNLPFELTNAQKKVIREIRHDTNKGKQMNRLLQGDVGSGKTLVALLSILLAIDNGFQGSIMVPTEILALQHYESISHLVKNLNIKVALLTGSTKRKNREEILQKLKNGEIQILIGTHTLIEDKVKFGNLGLVVIDEQHRFGVIQRSKLWDKNKISPHILVMTATPIPRTLAMTIYGDLNISIIDELPYGRKPVKTFHIYEKKKHELYNFIRKQLQIGKQIYIVYPIIENSEKIDLNNVKEGFNTIKNIFPEYNICMIHGKMKQEEKNTEIKKFISGSTQIMVATSVIEVGINIPNASIIIIENADRFGLSQLHQLRGRVGRSSEQSLCFLVTPSKLSNNAYKRLNVITKINNGFVIAEEDLKLRGSGSIDGTKQSGYILHMKIANLSQDEQILIRARNLAIKILNSDPTLENPQNILLKQQLDQQNLKYQTELARIS